MIFVPVSRFNWHVHFICKEETFLAPYAKILVFVCFKNKFRFFFFIQLKVSKFLMLIADPLSIKNRKSRLKTGRVCTNAGELSWRTDSSVSVCWVICLSLSVCWTSGSFTSFFSTNPFWLSETLGSKAGIGKTSISESDSDQEFEEETVRWFNDSPWPVFHLNFCRQTLSKWFFFRVIRLSFAYHL